MCNRILLISCLLPTWRSELRRAPSQRRSESLHRRDSSAHFCPTGERPERGWGETMALTSQEPKQLGSRPHISVKLEVRQVSSWHLKLPLSEKVSIFWLRETLLWYDTELFNSIYLLMIYYRSETKGNTQLYWLNEAYPLWLDTYLVVIYVVCSVRAYNNDHSATCQGQLCTRTSSPPTTLVTIGGNVGRPHP